MVFCAKTFSIIFCKEKSIWTTIKSFSFEQKMKNMGKLKILYLGDFEVRKIMMQI